MSRLWPNGSSTIPTVTAEYGVPHPTTSWHRGIDLIGFSTIHAADAGTVIFAGWNGTAGYEVKIRHDDGYYTRYLHLDWYFVYVGKHVHAGEDIAVMGATGTVTGLHLHFECIYPDGETRLNPRDYIGSTPPPPEPEPEPERHDIMAAPIVFHQVNTDGNQAYIAQGAFSVDIITWDYAVALCAAQGKSAVDLPVINEYSMAAVQDMQAKDMRALDSYIHAAVASSATSSALRRHWPVLVAALIVAVALVLTRV